MASDMTARQIIRAAYRRADEQLADIAAGRNGAHRWWGSGWATIPSARREYRRAEARRALVEAGMAETCGGNEE